MKAQYTAGPWIVKKDRESFVIYDEDDMRIAATWGFCAPDRKGQERANARLIAAAPDLLVALKGMLDWARRVKGLNPGMEIAEACNAIARAEGKE